MVVVYSPESLIRYTDLLIYKIPGDNSASKIILILHIKLMGNLQNKGLVNTMVIMDENHWGMAYEHYISINNNSSDSQALITRFSMILYH